MQITELSTSSDLISVAKLYATVFAGPEWQEVSRCPNCGQFSSSFTGSKCGNCKNILIEAYPEAETADYIVGELSKPLATGLLALENQIPVAFGWAYALNGLDFSLTKYNNSQSQTQIAQVVQDIDYYYISEVGVNPNFQRRGLGTQITSKLIRDKSPLLMRTSQNSAMLTIAKRLDFQPIVGLETGILDAENPARVILVKYD